jgi:uncharacterized membrane protein
MTVTAVRLPVPRRTISGMRQPSLETTRSGRLMAGLLAGVLVGSLPLPFDWRQRCLLGWCAGVAVYLALVWLLCSRMDAKRTREHAMAQDEPSLVLFLLLLLSTLACVTAIAFMMQEISTQQGWRSGFLILLLIADLALSWLFIQVLFSFHYAHGYYQSTDDAALQFPGGQEPDYFDFMYYAFVIGMTSQVSDVQVISRKLRRITLAHSVLSFGFNVLVIALSINVVAGILK